MQNLQRRMQALEQQRLFLKAERERVLREAERTVGRLNKAVKGKLLDRALRMVQDRINAEGWGEKIILARFDAESMHGPGSRHWKRLSPGYVQWRIKHGYGPGPILQRTGTLLAGALFAARNSFVWRKGFDFRIERVPVPYAKSVEASRSFMSPATKKEMSQVQDRVRMLLKKFMAKALRDEMMRSAS